MSLVEGMNFTEVVLPNQQENSLPMSGWREFIFLTQWECSAAQSPEALVSFLYHRRF